MPSVRAFPFKSDNLTHDGPNRTAIKDLEGFRWFIQNRVRAGTFYYTQRPKIGDTFILAWSEGRLPWTALGEGIVQACDEVKPRKSDEYPFEITLSEVRVYEAPRELPKRGLYFLTLTAEEYAAMSQATSVPFPIVFARIGWMARYDGPSLDDSRPEGGGSHNESSIGNEIFTFQSLGGEMYGYIQVPGRWKCSRPFTHSGVSGEDN